MKVTYKWLQEFVDIHWSPEELAEKLTLSGSEVESIEPVPPLFENVIVGQIKKVEPHPNTTHLKICTVNLGKNIEQIVCGAPNVKTGQYVPVGLPGAILHSGQEIQVAKIRGFSSYGMICSEHELGLSDVADKIMVLPQKYVPGCQFDPGNVTDDTVFDVFINPNRPDCMSVRGLAREITALSGNPLHDKPIELPPALKLPENSFSVEIEDTEKCPRYCGAVITGVQVKPSPYSIQQRLYAVGIRPISNIVDATNYCLVEWGHPLHAFDLKKLHGNRIIVKTARNWEEFTTLDNMTRTLNEEVLLICDRDTAVAIGGIMGGLNSEIQQDTADIFLESAYFQPKNILRSAKYLGLNTEASRRFERGMDPNFCLEALKRACALILKISPGQLHRPFFNVYPNRISNRCVSLRTKRLNAVLGTDFSKKQIEQSLSKLEIKAESKKDGFRLKIPTFRHDLTREIDLVEEVARIISLDKVKPKKYAKILLRNVVNPRAQAAAKLRSIMTEFGFVEVYNYSMIDIRLKEIFLDRGKPIVLQNPISPELSLMRSSLIPGLLQVARHNKNRGVDNMRIFELGSVYAKDFMQKEGKSEAHFLAGIIFGHRVMPSWDGKYILNDIFTVKGIIESFFRKISLDIIEIISYDSLYMEQAGYIVVDNRQIGSFGKYRNETLLTVFDEPVYIFELDTEEIINHLRKERYYNPYSKFPAAKRNLAFVIPDSLPVQEAINSIKEIGGSLLKSVDVEDVYKGKPVPEDSRSVKISLKFYAHDRSLLDYEVEGIIHNIIQAMRKKHNINIRS